MADSVATEASVEHTSERKPVVVRGSINKHQAMPWRALRGLSLVLALATGSTLLAEGAEKLEHPPNWRWWHVFWFHKNGAPRFADGPFYDTTHHQNRLPVCPPLTEPGYGYFQPCWRQLHVHPRCVTCETMPVSVSRPAQSVDLPPAPAEAPPVQEYAPPNPEENAPTPPLLPRTKATTSRARTAEFD